MSLPDENLRALKRSHKFLTSIMTMRKQTFRNMSLEEFETWRKEAIGCIRHFPFDMQLEELYSSLVCKECGQPVEFHKMGCESKGVASASELRSNNKGEGK
jgi:hypothetical protein